MSRHSPVATLVRGRGRHRRERAAIGRNSASQLTSGAKAGPLGPVIEQTHIAAFLGHVEVVALLQHQFMDAGPTEPRVAGGMRGNPVALARGSSSDRTRPSCGWAPKRSARECRTRGREPRTWRPVPRSRRPCRGASATAGVSAAAAGDVLPHPLVVGHGPYPRDGSSRRRFRRPVSRHRRAGLDARAVVQEVPAKSRGQSSARRGTWSRS